MVAACASSISSSPGFPAIGRLGEVLAALVGYIAAIDRIADRRNREALDTATSPQASS
jgi:hypothetical protein